MILGGRALNNLFLSGRWKAYHGNTKLSVDDLLIGPHSIDVTLGNTFKRHMQAECGPIDVKNPGAQHVETIYLDTGDAVVLKQGDFLLGHVNERFQCTLPIRVRGRNSLFATNIDGCSTLGRLGVGIHVTAGYGDYGFKGAYTIELFCHNPCGVILYTGMKIGQVTFTQVYQPLLYKGHYTDKDHNVGPVLPSLPGGLFPHESRKTECNTDLDNSSDYVNSGDDPLH